jgi:uncharacterized protein
MTKWKKIKKYFFIYYFENKKFLIQTVPFRIIQLDESIKQKNINKIINGVSKKNNLVDPGTYYLPLFIGTTNCNFKCKYCYAYQGTYGNKGMNIERKVINKTIDYLKKKMQKLSLKGNRKIIEFGLVFFGGESLLNFNVLKYLVKTLKSVIHDLNKNNKTIFKPLVIINTNGSLFKGQILDFIKKNKDILEIVVSFDGLHHDKYRVLINNKPTSKIVIDGIRTIKKLGVKFAIGCCEPPDEITNIDKNILYITKLFGKKTEINLAFIRGAIPQVKTKAIYPGALEKRYTEKSLIIFGKKVASLIKNGYTIFSKRFFNRIKEGGYIWRCPAALYEFCIYPGGNVYPCHNFISDKFKLGNILNKNFNPQKNQKIINKFKSRNIDKIACKNCIFQTICLSSFDCPSHSYYDLKNFYKVDYRTCASAKIIMEALIEKFIKQINK